MRDWGKFLPILALLAVGLFAAAPAAAQTGSVTGTILDASTGAPLDAVQLSLETVGTTGEQSRGPHPGYRPIPHHQRPRGAVCPSGPASGLRDPDPGRGCHRGSSRPSWTSASSLKPSLFPRSW